jgi:hypothetical protein
MSNALVGIGVIGYGYRRLNLVRNFAAGESSRVIGVADLGAAKLAKCTRFHPEVVTIRDVRDLRQNLVEATITDRSRRSRWGSPAPSHSRSGGLAWSSPTINS